MREPRWRKSSHSHANGSCVEVADLDSKLGVRDSKNPDAGHLVFTPAAFGAFLDTVKAGRLDLSA